MALTQVQIQANLDAALAAYTTALTGASYSIGSGGTSRGFARQSLTDLLSAVRFWERRLFDITNSRTGIRVKSGLALNDSDHVTT